MHSVSITLSCITYLKIFADIRPLPLFWFFSEYQKNIFRFLKILHGMNCPKFCVVNCTFVIVYRFTKTLILRYPIKNQNNHLFHAEKHRYKIHEMHYIGRYLPCQNHKLSKIAQKLCLCLLNCFSGTLGLTST